MKIKQKKISLIPLLLVIVMSLPLVLAGCKGNVTKDYTDSFRGVVDSYPEAPSPAVLKSVFGDAGTFVDSASRLLITSDSSREDSIRVYDFVYEREVKSFSGASSVALLADGIDLFVAVENGVRTVYDADGTVVATADASCEIELIGNEFFTFSAETYRIIDNCRAELTAFTEMNPAVKYDERIEDFGYVITKDGFSVYENYELFYSYSVPEHADSAVIFVLENGNVAVQYRVMRYEDEKFDVVINGNKYEICTLLINPRSASEKKINTDYLFVEVMADIDGSGLFKYLKRSIKNIAYVCEISGKRLCDRKIVVMDNDLSVGRVLCDYTRGEFFFPISEDRIIAYVGGRGTLTDFNGDAVGSINIDAVEGITRKYIVTKNAIYNMELEVIQKTADQGYVYVDNLGESLIFEKDFGTRVAYYIYNGSFVQIANSKAEFLDEEAVRSEYRIAVVHRDGKYIYYNEAGTELASTDTKIEWQGLGEQGYSLGWAKTSTGAFEYFKLTLNAVDADIFLEMFFGQTP